MKITKCSIRLVMMTSIVLVLVIFIIKPSKAQNQKSEGGSKTMKIKVVKEKDGKKTVFDTTFYAGNPMNQEEIAVMIKNLKSDMKDLEMQMKNRNFDYTMKAIDSLEMDSLAEGLEKVIVIGDCGKNGKLGCTPNGYRYDFDFDYDIPNIPECPMMWQDFEGEEFNLHFPQPNGILRFNGENEAGSLNELLGKIPMERVKSYSIKDRKNGKRIIIDVENGPMFESGDKTIIIRKSGHPAGKKHRHGEQDRNVKVIIKSDEKESKDKI